MKHLVIALTIILLATNSLASETSLFATPDGLKAEVEFWKQVYTEYTTDQAILHDPDNLGKIYGVIELPHCNEPPTAECLKKRQDAIDSEKDRINNTSPKATTHHQNVLKQHRHSTAARHIRAQVGQKDKFVAGLAAAEKYIPKIEEIFKEYGVPNEISRMPFVESMFNLNARSKVGASGIWQIMPRTARIFGLKVTKKTDDRNDPLKATRAAARHLLRDYNRFGKWELAINAYNTGPGRIANAIAMLGTKDIVTIIRSYEHHSYGFASRNFYPEFLAALDVYENREHYFAEVLNGNNMQVGQQKN